MHEIFYKDISCVLHSEFEVADKGEMAYRLLEYYGILYRKYQKPIISMLIYPFETTISESPLSVRVGNEEILTFHFRVVALWKLDAQDYLTREVVSLYNLLPTMQGATYERLKMGLDGIKEHYGEDRKKLAEQLLWFDTFLQRSTVVDAEDKRRMEAQMEEFGSLLEESRFVKKAKAEGLEKGMITALQKAVVEIVEERFPPLAEFAERQVAQIQEPQALHLLVKRVSTASDESAVRRALTAPAA